MKRYPTITLIMVLSVFAFIAGAQEPEHSPSPVISITEVLDWNPVQAHRPDSGDWVRFLSFAGSGMRNETGSLPVYFRASLLENPDQDWIVERSILASEVYVPLTPEEILTIGDQQRIPEKISPSVTIGYTRKKPRLEVTFLPFRRDPVSGLIEKLQSFQLQISLGIRPQSMGNPGYHSFASESVLATGSWYRFAAARNGVFQLTYDDLKNSGVDPASIDPRTLKIYGNGGGMLPEANSASRTDDLRELSVQVTGEGDGRFDPGDFLLFYGESQEVWTLNPMEGLFRHEKNIYADYTYYFLTFGGENGKRIAVDPGSSSPASYTISRFNDFACYEKDDINLIKSGREWFDQEYFDVTTTRNYSFAFPNLDETSPAFIKALVAARSTSGSSSFTVSANGTSLFSVSLPSVSTSFLATWARQKAEQSSISVTGSTIGITLKYNKPNSTAIGYLNYLELNVRRNLIMTGNQLSFRSVESVGTGRVTEFSLTTQGQQLVIWDVTDAGNVSQIQHTVSGSTCSFRVPTDFLREFIAFDGAAYLKPEFVGVVENQNLHGTGSVDYVIVAYPAFIAEAERLAAFHRQKNGLDVLVTTPQAIYNEFSSGAQDISAIRDFIRMLYVRAAAGDEPRYLLLFGDASYDHKSRLQSNTNLVPAYESPESLDPVDSYVTDDFFALLDDTETIEGEGSLDLGVGRLPVMTETQARQAIDKILHYCSESDTVKNDWRNMLAFVADDGDGNLHLDQVEKLTDQITGSHPVYNIDKIYLDAYQQISTPGGQRCPKVNDLINKRVGKGALIVNYTGHGGELGWAHERVLEVADIQSWTNFSNMPVFFTATCEFSRYDDPQRVSAGEWVFLNPKGGGIALFTTTRPTYAGSNFVLATKFYAVAFDKQAGSYRPMGDLIMDAKNATTASSNTRKFVLIGDPALTMAYPKIRVVTTSISSDTLMALSEITVNGQVQYDDGQPATGFSGMVFPTVFDKPTEVMTLGNDGDAPVEFLAQKNQIYKGQVLVDQGAFQFSFIVPKDIAYKFGQGKISYYARSEQTDAHGFDPTVVVGGFNPQVTPDEQGPVIELFMNNTSFVSGGITNQNPVLLAFISDESGINTVGNGIGHDITATLDADTKNAMILNDYYVADLNTYKSGQIAYPYSGLAEGRHTLTLKVWDVFNNSSEAVISFDVRNTQEFILDRLYNYPNPFREKTTFVFETNQAGHEAELELEIYTVYGKRIRTIKSTLYLTGYRMEPLSWDGTGDGGWQVGSGTYVYRLRLSLPDGSQNQTTGKLVVIR